LRKCTYLGEIPFIVLQARGKNPNGFAGMGKPLHVSQAWEKAFMFVGTAKALS